MKYDLVGVDGNAFAVMGYVSIAMMHEGYSREEIDQYRKDAMSGNYDNLLLVSFNKIEEINERCSNDCEDDEEEDDV